MPEKIPTRLGEIIEEFEFCEGREKLELLIQYAQSCHRFQLGWRTNAAKWNQSQSA
jgi:sulfur transfer protein SufE